MKATAMIVCLLALGVPGDNLEGVKRTYAAELRKLEREHAARVAKLRAKYHEKARKGKVAATKAGKLDQALAWRAWEEELGQERKILHGRNIAPKAEIAVSSEESPRSHRYLVDGIVPKGLPQKDRRFWFPSSEPGRDGWWVSFQWPRAVEIFGVRFVAPRGRKWADGGHEPLEYVIECLDGGKLLKRYPVKRHPKSKDIADGKGIMVEVPLPETRCDRVRFVVTKVSGPSSRAGPVVWELEIIGR